MICFLIRHGKDDETVRGGWSKSNLSQLGIEQASVLAQQIQANNSKYNIGELYSSDLIRAVQTAEIIAQRNDLPIFYCPQFRETNNGLLAGMKNEHALINYPNLFWNTLEWDEHYPEGESPKEFYERINMAWNDFSKDIILKSQNIAIVTHSGVISIILHIIENRPWSNKNFCETIPYATLIPIEYDGTSWRRL